MIIDVRSPKEFAHAHIPGALNIPLFSDEERHLVGLCYKKEGKNAAFDLGLRLTAPKFPDFVRQVRPYPSIEVCCWRGGMRSQSMGWLFTQAGIPTRIRPGGYKAFRQEVLEILARPYNLHVITGLTGVGKTEALHHKEQKIDLEGLAHHRGSAFGGLGQLPQPSNEQLENLLAVKLLELDPQREIWVEDESRVIGSCKIPDSFFEQMRRAPRTELVAPMEERISRLRALYGSFPREALEQAIWQLEKRLGRVRTQEAVNLLKESRLEKCIALLLTYYDKAYEKSRMRYNRNDGTFQRSGCARPCG